MSKAFFLHVNTYTYFLLLSSLILSFQMSVTVMINNHTITGSVADIRLILGLTTQGDANPASASAAVAVPAVSPATNVPLKDGETLYYIRNRQEPYTAVYSSGVYTPTEPGYDAHYNTPGLWVHAIGKLQLSTGMTKSKKINRETLDFCYVIRNGKHIYLRELKTSTA
jgi:hypothetical protein